MTVQAFPFTTAGPSRARRSGGVDGSGGADGRLRTRLGSVRGFVGQAVRYSLVGTTGTAVYIGLYLLLDMWTQPVVGNALAWLITTLATNRVQRSFAFGVADHQRARVDQIVGLASSGVALLITTLAVAGLTGSDSAAQVLALIVVNVLVGTARFLTVRWWFSHARQTLPAL